MKTVLKIATVLTRFNLVVWVFIILLMTLAFWYMQFISLLFIPFLLTAVVLNCYAALRLQKALRYPAIQLSNQTPAGIRFIGFVALSLAITCIVYAFMLMIDAPASVTLTKETYAPVKRMWRVVITRGHFQCLGAIVVSLGLCISVNVVLNFCLLRHYFTKQHDK